jgi:hypothetical protein
VLVGDDFDVEGEQRVDNRQAALQDVLEDFLSIGSLGNNQAQVPTGAALPAGDGVCTCAGPAWRGRAVAP